MRFDMWKQQEMFPWLYKDTDFGDMSLLILI